MIQRRGRKDRRDGIFDSLADQKGGEDFRRRIVIYSKFQGPFVIADCWLAACAKGLGTCVIGFAIAALNTPQWKAELKIPAETTAVAPIIGRACWRNATRLPSAPRDYCLELRPAEMSPWQKGPYLYRKFTV